jgi:hypothetical protein
MASVNFEENDDYFDGGGCGQEEQDEEQEEEEEDVLETDAGEDVEEDNVDDPDDELSNISGFLSDDVDFVPDTIRMSYQEVNPRLDNTDDDRRKILNSIIERYNVVHPIDEVWIDKLSTMNAKLLEDVLNPSASNCKPIESPKFFLYKSILHKLYNDLQGAGEANIDESGIILYKHQPQV